MSDPELNGKKREGFTMIPNALFDDPRLTASRKLVLFAIIKHDWGERGDGCTASYQTLARETSQSKSAVYRAVSELDGKFVDVERQSEPSKAEGKKGMVYKPSRIRVQKWVRDILPASDKHDRDSSQIHPKELLTLYSPTGEKIRCSEDEWPSGYSDQPPAAWRLQKPSRA